MANGCLVRFTDELAAALAETVDHLAEIIEFNRRATAASRRLELRRAGANGPSRLILSRATVVALRRAALGYIKWIANHASSG